MSKNSPKSSDSDHIQNLKLARRTSVAIGAAFCILFAALVGFTSLRPSPLSSIGGPFSLISHTGQTLTEKEFLGRPFLIFFGYTHCLDICPIKLFEISEILRVLGPQAEIGAMFVTVDPERDTPDVIKDYLANFDPRIIGLTGDRAAIESMLREYGIYAKKAMGKSGDYGVDHTTVVYLMGKDGRLVRTLNVDRDPLELARELRFYL
jgi:protein SCO1/2